MTKDVRQVHSEMLQYKVNYRDRRDQLDQLRLNYEQSKQLNPFSRYGQMKRMIKTTVRPVTVPKDMDN